MKIIIGTGEAILTAIGAPPRARWFPLGGMQRAMPGLLISSRCLAPTRPPWPLHGRLNDPCSQYCLAPPPPRGGRRKNRCKKHKRGSAVAQEKKKILLEWRGPEGPWPSHKHEPPLKLWFGLDPVCLPCDRGQTCCLAAELFPNEELPFAMAAVATKGQTRASRHDALTSWFFPCCGYEPRATPCRGAKKASFSSVGSKREELSH